MELILIFLATLAVVSGQYVSHLQLQSNVGQLFNYKIEPQLFNWTHQVISEQFRYRPSLQQSPDLPSWMRYMYSNEYHAGFLYGTPPDDAAGTMVNLDVVALNSQNYETRQVLIDLFVSHKFQPPNIVQMKIDNLNWVHLMDPGRVENLRNIFRKDLWPDSKEDLSIVFMESAVNLGGRLPLRPQQREGVVVHVGSFSKFSSRLQELQEEVRPLYKLSSCTYKRTSVQKIFENVGFKLDWCAFKMVGIESPTEVLYHNNYANAHQSEPQQPDENVHSDRWVSVSRDDVPNRNYIDEFAFAFAIPGVILAVLVGMLSAILCFKHRKFYDPQSEFFFANIFHMCEEQLSRSVSDEESESSLSTDDPMSSPIEMIKCLDTTPLHPMSTLKCLKDPDFLLDDCSLRSLSPINSLYQLDFDFDLDCGHYTRPLPPPYQCATMGCSDPDI
ncbi:Scgalpha [Drosophila busckii]|uniref:Scgalpha n=1 Tax=Drosophila busckii TaxID=30019 RepID=A0A0M4E9K5_DROBS|nr:epsilon-sarcoglycan [Drosophila busckii]ALC38901.1 Scgalpha [Drosophila busckii]